MIAYNETLNGKIVATSADGISYSARRDMPADGGTYYTVCGWVGGKMVKCAERVHYVDLNSWLFTVGCPDRR